MLIMFLVLTTLAGIAYLVELGCLVRNDRSVHAPRSHSHEIEAAFHTQEAARTVDQLVVRDDPSDHARRRHIDSAGDPGGDAAHGPHRF
jgi:hypothetical protein